MNLLGEGHTTQPFDRAMWFSPCKETLRNDGNSLDSSFQALGFFHSVKLLTLSPSLSNMGNYQLEKMISKMEVVLQRRPKLDCKFPHKT